LFVLAFPESAARELAEEVAQGAKADRAELITNYDTYYYARAGREMHLPAWRIVMGDPGRSVVYLDPIDGSATGFVDRETRLTRWLRDALHSFDYSALNARPTLWRALLLVLLSCGIISAFTGVTLGFRRLRREWGAGRTTGAATTNRSRLPNSA